MKKKMKKFLDNLKNFEDNIIFKKSLISKNTVFIFFDVDYFDVNDINSLENRLYEKFGRKFFNKVIIKLFRKKRLILGAWNKTLDNEDCFIVKKNGIWVRAPVSCNSDVCWSCTNCSFLYK